MREGLSGRSLNLEALTDRVLAALAQTGRLVQRDGKPVPEPTLARAVLRVSLKLILANRLPVPARLGAFSV